MFKRWLVLGLLVISVFAGSCRRAGLQPGEGHIDVPGGRIWYRIVGESRPVVDKVRVDER